MFDYLEPSLLVYKTYSEFKENYNKYGSLYVDKRNIIELKDILDTRGAFVIAEPGYGKSRLLKEIINLASKEGKQAAYFDLKQLEAADIPTFIGKKIFPSIKNIKSEKDLKQSDNFSSDYFQLTNSQNTILCLDALDEVKTEYVPDIIENIKKFISQYPEVKLFISCRAHQFIKISNAVKEIPLDYINIKAFDYKTYKGYLVNAIGEKYVENIERIIKSYGRESIISIPRYLELIKEYIIEKGLENFKIIKKTDLFEYFIYEKLKKESAKTDYYKKDIFKRILEKLALTMEIYQSNAITLDEFMTFFDDIKSGLTQGVLSSEFIKEFIDKSVLKTNVNSEEIEILEFENAEFQEYLAAKELFQLGKVEQSIFNLAFDPIIREIYPSWVGTLGFVVDMDINILKLILSFLESKPKSNFSLEEYHRLITKVDVNRLSHEDRKNIFQFIFNYYFNSEWIPYDLSFNLSYYYVHDLNPFIKRKLLGSFKTKNYLGLGNTLRMIDCLFALENSYLDKNAWLENIEGVIDLTNVSQENNVVIRTFLHLLRNYKDIQLIKKYNALLNSKDQLVVEAYINACAEVNPNDEYSIDCFIKSIKSTRYIQGFEGILQINNRKSMIYFLNALSVDLELLKKFIDRRTIFTDRNLQLIKEIKDMYNNEIEKSLIQIVNKTFENDIWGAENSDFIKQVVLIINDHKTNYAINLLDAALSFKEPLHALYELPVIFASIIKTDQVIIFFEKLKEKYLRTFLYTVEIVKETRNEEGKDIYKTAKKMIPNVFMEREKEYRNIKRRKPEDRKRYDKFRYLLGPEGSKYFLNVFTYYLENEESIKKFETSEDIIRMKYILEVSILDKVNPLDHTLTITEKSNNNISYSVNSLIPLFGDCIRIADKFKWQDIIDKYREKIISYIPFAYYEHLDAIFSLIPTINHNERNTLLNIYAGKRDDDLVDYNPENIIRAIVHYEIPEGKTILKKSVSNQSNYLHIRQEALQALVSIKENKRYFEKIFDDYILSNDSKVLAEDANKYLVSIYHTENAINWRFNQLKSRKFKFTRPSGGHSIGQEEHELNDKRFARPLMELNDPKFIEMYLDLLKFSFEIIEEDVKFEAYAFYIWEIVIAFFNNLKALKNYNYILEIEKYVDSLGNKKNINWFVSRLKDLKREYLIYFGKKINYSECVKVYNEIKSGQYIDITNDYALFEKIANIVNNELSEKVELERLIQQTMKSELRALCLSGGIHDVNIRREEMLDNNEKIDFLIWYGFLGPILIEIKLLHNPEAWNIKQSTAYKIKMKRYMRGSKSKYGIFLIFKVRDHKDKLSKHIERLSNLYADIKAIRVLGIDCTE